MKAKKTDTKQKTSQKIKTHIKSHRWDETMVITVMVVSAICILILIAAYISITGEAIRTTQPTASGIVEMLNEATVESGSGKTRCDVICAGIGKTCIIARSGNELITCSAKINGDYRCVCASP